MELFPYQQEAVDKLHVHRARLIGDDMGLGKTYECIAIDQVNRSGDGHKTVREAIEAGKIDLGHAKTLIVCPKSVISVWDEHCIDLTDQDVYVLDPKNRSDFVRKALNPKRGGYFILNWEALRLKECEDLQKITWFHIIADEVHRAKNRKAQQTLALKRQSTWYKTGASGTPADNRPQDLWSILNWLWPNYYTSYNRFVKMYINQVVEEDREGNEYKKLLEPMNLPHLHRQMDPWYVRRLKENVLTDLPEKYYSRIWVDLDPKQRRAYDSMRKTMTVWVEDNREGIEAGDPMVTIAVVAQLIRLQQLACGYLVARIDPETGDQVIKVKFEKGTPKDFKAHFRKVKTEAQYFEVLDQVGTAYETDAVLQWDVYDPSSKLDAIMELLNDRPEDEPVVIFSQFKSVINLLRDRLVDRQIPFGIITGDVQQSDRAQYIQAFQRGELRVFLGTVQAGGVGITLTRASTVIFIDRTWSPAINRQAEDRLHRIGQKNAVQVIDFMARNTVDLGKAQQLATKWKWLQMILGDEITSQTIRELSADMKDIDLSDIIKELEEDE